MAKTAEKETQAPMVRASSKYVRMAPRTPGSQIASSRKAGSFTSAAIDVAPLVA